MKGKALKPKSVAGEAVLPPKGLYADTPMMKRKVARADELLKRIGMIKTAAKK